MTYPQIDMTPEELAEEIAEHLGSSKRKDKKAIAEWIHDSNDDGSPVPTLAMRFDAEVGLPSRRT